MDLKIHAVTISGNVVRVRHEPSDDDDDDGGGGGGGSHLWCNGVRRTLHGLI